MSGWSGPSDGPTEPECSPKLAASQTHKKSLPLEQEQIVTFFTFYKELLRMCIFCIHIDSVNLGGWSLLLNSSICGSFSVFMRDIGHDDERKQATPESAYLLMISFSNYKSLELFQRTGMSYYSLSLNNVVGFVEKWFTLEIQSRNAAMTSLL